MEKCAWRFDGDKKEILIKSLLYGRKHELKKNNVYCNELHTFPKKLNLLFGWIKFHSEAIIHKWCFNRDIDIQKNLTIERERVREEEREKGERIKEERKERLLLLYCFVEWISMYN